MTLEARLVYAHIELQVAPTDGGKVKYVPVVRHGAYELRLVEPTISPCANPFDFWLELFDHSRKISVDSGGADDLETAVTIAEALVAEAKALVANPEELRKIWPEVNGAHYRSHT